MTNSKLDDLAETAGDPDVTVLATSKPRRPRGFAAMDRARVKAIASAGGKAAHAQGTAHQFTSDEARAAGKKGGSAWHARRGRGPMRERPAPPLEELGSAELDEPTGGEAA